VAARPQDLSGVVLAAGAGERMGGPKAMLVVDGEALALLHVRRLREAGCARVVLVTRPELAERLRRAEHEVAVSTAPDPAGSLAVGLRALDPSPVALVAITPVDALPARAATIARLAAAVGADVEAATPSHGGRGGHPVLLRAGVLAGFIDAPRPLRDVLAALGARRARVEVDDPAVAIDLDSPADVVAATGASPRFA
jgi:CTP:molybdopterin cytidylyltransferase MocA